MRRRKRRIRSGALLITVLAFLIILRILLPGGAMLFRLLREYRDRFVPQEQSALPAYEGTDAPEPSPDDWRLVLVNYENPVPEDHEFTLIDLRNGQAVDERIYPDLQQMFDDARADGISILVTSSYRSYEDQQEILERFIRGYEDQGCSEEEAKEKAEAQVNRPGYSEHQLGLGIDINSEDSSVQSSDHAWRWLKENSWKYGFVQRYPADKTEITHVIDEPWHYRYVGKEAAEVMHENNWCLEEYLAALR